MTAHHNRGRDPAEGVPAVVEGVGPTHHGGWSIIQPADGGGDIHWISPTGRHYVVHPTRRVPVFTTGPPGPADDASPPF